MFTRTHSMALVLLAGLALAGGKTGRAADVIMPINTKQVASTALQTTKLQPVVYAQTVETTSGAIEAVDVADRVVRDLQLELIAAVQSDDTQLMTDVLEELVLAEVELQEALDAAWTGMSSPEGSPVWVNQPLMLAMLELQIETRRALGPVYQTLVPGLDEDPGCAGDIVGERLIYAYGAAATSPGVAHTEGTEVTSQVLTEIAVQVACLGARQLADLEATIAIGFDAVADHMTVTGRADLISAFARILAPVQVILLDASKHRGEASETFVWFAEHAETLRNDVALSGWPTGQLMLWDRRHGMLVGMPGCQDDPGDPRCVDFDTFLDSIRDPRALGLGDCAFSGMVMAGTMNLGGDELYACPTDPCTQPSLEAIDAVPSDPSGLSGTTVAAGTGGFSVPELPESHLDSMWSELDGTDRAAMAGICRAAEDFIGAGVVREDCLDIDLTPEPSPFDSWAACVVDALGAGEEPRIGADLGGVPMGRECRLMDGSSNTPPAGESVEPAENAAESSDDETADTGWWDALWQAVVAFFSSDAPEKAASSGLAKGIATGSKAAGGATGAGGVAITSAAQLLNPQIGPGAVEGGMQLVMKHKLERAYRDGLIDEGGLIQGRDAMSRGDIDTVQRILGQGGGARGCADPASCGNECSALGRQLSAVTACTEGLMGDVLEEAGLGDRGDVRPRIDFVSKPNPEQSPRGDTSEFGPCLTGDTGPGQISPGCGLILCPDGFLADGMVQSCRCDAQSFFMVEQMCLVARCADEVLPEPDCSCPIPEGYDPGGVPPGPSPMTKIAGIDDLEKSSTTFLYKTGSAILPGSDPLVDDKGIIGKGDPIENVVK